MIVTLSMEFIGGCPWKGKPAIMSTCLFCQLLLFRPEYRLVRWLLFQVDLQTVSAIFIILVCDAVFRGRRATGPCFGCHAMTGLFWLLCHDWANDYFIMASLCSIGLYNKNALTIMFMGCLGYWLLSSRPK